MASREAKALLVSESLLLLCDNCRSGIERRGLRVAGEIPEAASTDFRILLLKRTSIEKTRPPFGSRV